MSSRQNKLEKSLIEVISRRLRIFLESEKTQNRSEKKVQIERKVVLLVSEV